MQSTLEVAGVTGQGSAQVACALVNFASIPSPSTGVWHLGPIPIRAYALAIVAGIFLAVWITERRLRRRGAPPGMVVDIAVWAVPFGIIGARLYHVITDAQLYFGPGRDPIDALKVWNGGLGIPGALIAGAFGAWLACRKRGIPLSMLADAVAPALPVAQAVGRLGNWFNQELYGRPTNLPWGLEIDAFHRRNLDPAYQQFETFHPTFLYEALWNLGGAGLIWWLDKRFRFGRGRAFALYVIMYSVGRFWVESLRIDSAHEFGGLRLNMWVAVLGLIGGLAYFLLVRGPQQRLVYGDDGTVTTEDEAVAGADNGSVPDGEAGSAGDTTPDPDTEPGDPGEDPGEAEPDPDPDEQDSAAVGPPDRNDPAGER
ncbi:MAG: prolipoprotein diacylglyceryl transferase [Micromonosporaceae bacterium]